MIVTFRVFKGYNQGNTTTFTMRSFILLIAFCAVAGFAVAQKTDKDRKAGLKPLKQSEVKSDDEREMRKIASGRGEEELEEEIERSLERLDKDMDMNMDFDMDIDVDPDMHFQGLDEEIERNIEMSLEGLDEQIEMSVQASMEGVEEALEALEHLDFDIDIRVDDEMVNVREEIKQAMKEAKQEMKEAKKEIKQLRKSDPKP